jgi:transposase
MQQYTYSYADDSVRWRSDAHSPPASLLISSPYDPAAHMSIKRSTVWTGSKVPVSETCEDDQPHLLVPVETTPATTQDREMTSHLHLHDALAAKHRLPGTQVVDTGYVDGEHLLVSQTEHQIALLGPSASAANWQKRAGNGGDVAHFRISWHDQKAICPQGRQSRKWKPGSDRRGNAIIHVELGPQDCLACPARADCPQAADNPRQLTLRPQAVYEATHCARQRQPTPAFTARYAMRAGVEGTLSQGVRACDLRQARYIGIAKTHLQHLLTATAMNMVRLLDWILQRPRTTTRTSHFAALAC